jgi:hypothetical protein
VASRDEPCFFPHYLLNGTIFGKYLLNIKFVFWLPVQLSSETFLILRMIQLDIIINDNVLRDYKHL